MSPLISLVEVTKAYFRDQQELPVLRRISLDIGANEYVALTGSSGSGKSTLLNVLGCLDRPTSGSYHLEGRDVSTCSVSELAHVRNEKFGFVFQNFQLLRRTTALENVLIPMRYSATPMPRQVARDRATMLLRQVGLGDRLNHAPSQMSGGQQQRVALARALINQPRILLADEPTGNLDSATSNEVLNLIEEVHRETGLTIIMVTHEPNIAERAQRIIRLSDGNIVDNRKGKDPAGDSDAHT